MAANAQQNDAALQQAQEPQSDVIEGDDIRVKVPRWKRLLGTKALAARDPEKTSSAASVDDGYQDMKSKPEKWSLGVLNDRQTDEVPGM